MAANLTEEQARNAIGLAVTMASGLWEGLNSDAVMAKHLHLGLAAERECERRFWLALDGRRRIQLSKVIVGSLPLSRGRASMRLATILSARHHRFTSLRG